MHNKEFGKNQDKLLSLIGREKPNLIVITGDIVDSNNTDINAALQFVKGAVSIAPVYYVTGNHEYWLNNNDLHRLIAGMEQYGVKILENKAVNIENGSNNGFYLIGLSDKNLVDSTLKTLCSYLDSDELQIVLAHEPQNLNSYSEANNNDCK